MQRALDQVREAIRETPFWGDTFLVGGVVRDELLGLPPQDDADIVTRGDAGAMATLLWERGVAEHPPVLYPRFGTAMVRVGGVAIELVTARRESYDPESRKPLVEAATYEEDARRRDFTVNALLRSLADGELRDPLGMGLQDLRDKILRTPLPAEQTFRDDPLRMLRAVRFRWKLGFQPALGLYEAVRRSRDRLEIVSQERIRDELIKMLVHDTAPDALEDLRSLGLLDIFAPELVAMAGVEQGNFHHLDVWHHSLLVLRNVGAGDLTLALGALLHDIGKPSTRFIDEAGNVRFFGHESVGANMARTLLRRLRIPQRQIDEVCLLVRHHMRLGSSPTFSPAAARRVVRDLGTSVDRLLTLVEADANGLKRGVRKLDLTPIRQQIERVRAETPAHVLESPLSGEEIMQAAGIASGPEVGELKQWLTERVLEGELAPHDKEEACRLLAIRLPQMPSPDRD